MVYLTSHTSDKDKKNNLKLNKEQNIQYLLRGWVGTSFNQVRVFFTKISHQSELITRQSCLMKKIIASLKVFYSVSSCPPH